MLDSKCIKFEEKPLWRKYVILDALKYRIWIRISHTTSVDAEKDKMLRHGNKDIENFSSVLTLISN